MGEHSPSPPNPQPPNPIPPETTINSDTITTEPQRTTEFTNVPSSPPSKIPLRPRKMRKLSPSNDHGSSKPKPNVKSKSSQSVPRNHARSLACQGELEAAIQHLRNADPLLSSLIDIHPPPTFDSFQPPFLALVRSILYQQLAAKAGSSIYTRFVELCGGENGVVPENVLLLTPQQLRQIGVSGRKASYLHDLARKYQNGILSDDGIVKMDDKSLFTMLTMVNGIGSWSVHMFMINSLHMPDVLPVNDLGLRKGVQILNDLPELPRPSQMESLCEKWRPYRSVASWYMWRLIESKLPPSNGVGVAAGAAALSFPQMEEIQQQQLLDPLNSVFSIGYSQFLSD